MWTLLNSVKKIILLSLSFFAFWGIAFAVSPNTGFVSDEIWFSQEKIKEGDSLKIYSAVFNGEEKEINLSLVFFDDDVVLSKKEIKLSPGETKTVSADFKASLGDHVIYSEILGATKLGESFIPEKTKTSKTKISISKDIPASVAKDALVGNIGSILKTDSEKANEFKFWLSEHFKKSEEFRNTNLQKFEDLKEKISNKKELNKDSKTPTRVMIFLHLVLISLIVFILSIVFVFYALCVLVSYFILRKVWGLILRIFRKKHEE